MKFVTFGALRRKGIVGMNYRNVELIGRYNPRSHYPLVDNKLMTKELARNSGVPVTELYATIERQSQLRNLHDILAPYGSFVVKPDYGSGGKGIVVITHREGDTFIKASGDALSLNDLRKHISNILSGLYSLGGRYDTAIIEKVVAFDPMFADYSFEGVPDIRIIVYRGYPVMAMMRCPTRESDGKANLHQGAVGVGLSLKDGSALSAVIHDRPVTHHPDTHHDFAKLKVPQWEAVLTMAASCYEMTGLGYLGADIVFDKNDGALMLELNARPGLAIQIANGRGLRERLETVDRQKQPRTAAERVLYSMNYIE
ncbi:alpha-L-glutamate ligase-like protein [Sulfurimonas sp. HSL1-2]|uniref:alpha-L-glutamate ligase-like protein n=1 Tax=Thiomicrolovo zhangzhouensis TaxID=3131933 RepID=UPI0031F96F7E